MRLDLENPNDCVAWVNEGTFVRPRNQIPPEDTQRFVNAMRYSAASKEAGKASLPLLSQSRPYTSVWRFQRAEGHRFVLRQLESGRPSFALQPSLSPWLVNELLSPEPITQGGLWIFSGVAGTRKSTLASATLVERLQRYGGYALELSDPPERPAMKGHYPGLDGRDGFIEQIETTDVGLAHAIRKSFRLFPSETKAMMFVGEVLDGQGMAEVLRLAARGCHVITTMHARSPSAAVEMLVAMAINGGEHSARTIAAHHLSKVFHCKMVEGRLFVSMLNCLDQRVRNMLSQEEKSFSQLDGLVKPELMRAV